MGGGQSYADYEKAQFARSFSLSDAMELGKSGYAPSGFDSALYGGGYFDPGYGKTSASGPLSRWGGQSFTAHQFREFAKEYIGTYGGEAYNAAVGTAEVPGLIDMGFSATDAFDIASRLKDEDKRAITNGDLNLSPGAPKGYNWTKPVTKHYDKYGVKLPGLELDPEGLPDDPERSFDPNYAGNYTGPSTELSPGDAGYGGAKPIVLDLDGDGVELLSVYNSNVTFDHDDDGFKEQIGWISADDGFLIHDKDGDGTVSSAEELIIANQTEEEDTDLEALETLFDFDVDGIKDGVFDANDTAWDQFYIWRDLDQDGESDEGELITLSDAGITSISLEEIPGTSYLIPDVPLSCSLFPA